MRLRRLIALGIALLTTFALALPVAAGGWAVTTMEGVPAELEEGASYTFTYTIRQHGQHPVDVDKTFVRLWSEKTGEEFFFPGEPTGQEGAYQVDVTMPTAGDWQWEVNQGMFGEQSLGSLTVNPAAPVSTSIWDSNALQIGLPIAAAVTIVLFALQAGLLLRDRRKSELSGQPAQAGD